MFKLVGGKQEFKPGYTRQGKLHGCLNLECGWMNCTKCASKQLCPEYMAGNNQY